MSTDVGRRGRISGWYHGRSLRSRLAVLTAVAVAVAIAVCSVACWFIVRTKLYDLTRTQLETSQGPFLRLQDFGCGGTPPAAAAAALATYESRSDKGGFPRWDTELVDNTGTTVCVAVGPKPRAIEFRTSDLGVLDQLATLKPHQPPTESFRTGQYTDGEAAMLRLSPVVISGQPVLLLTATPLTKVNESLQQLALILLGVVGVGALGAGITGRLVARTALKPVHELTDVVEHIARTEEVGTTIPVHGNDEIARLSGSFNSMSTALANSRERQTRLIADAGHELRTPLTSLRTNVDLLIRSDDTGRPLPPATRTKLLGSMKAQMQELTLLIGDLLQLSRPDTPRPGQIVSIVALHEIAQRAVERGKLRGPGLSFEVSLAPWYVQGDSASLERAVVNLLDNAVKYSPPGGTIEVALHGGRLTVRDHGPGIPEDELQYVFDRFWRSPSSRQLPGSGLGLSIVAQAVRESGGQVALGPAQDGGPGALATVRLPGAPEPPPTDRPGMPADSP